MHPYAIRQAAAQMPDARLLQAIEASTLGDSDLSAAEICATLAMPGQRAYLAEVADQVVGFLATFLTFAPTGPRLELDMLGVAEGWRGRGIGQALVRRAMDDAAQQGVGAFRAVVAADNAASGRVFERCGLVPEQAMREMLVYPIVGATPQAYLPDGWREAEGGPANGWPEALLAFADLPEHQVVLLQDAAGKPAGGAALLTVHTIAYQGYWIEAHWASGHRAQRALARAAVERAKAADLDEVGLLLATSPTEAELQPWLAEGYHRAGAYRMYTHHEAR